MKRKIRIALCCAAILFALSGCQLAQENASGVESEDKLIGVYITTEHLDLFDIEGYINDNLKGFSNGRIIVDGNTQKYQGRLYATLKTTTLTSEESGETTEIDDFVFENVEGFPYFAAVMPATERNENSYTSSTSDEAISDSHMAIKGGDDEDTLTLTGTVYVSPTGQNQAFYLNPVYQSTDGSVYLTAGTGLSAPMAGEGEQMSQNIDESRRATENGKSKTEKTSVTISFNVLFAAEKIVILQMGADANLISRDEYDPNNMPDIFHPEPGVEYLIAETYKRDLDGKLYISRDIFGTDAQSVETFNTRQDGICVKHWAQIEW